MTTLTSCKRSARSLIPEDGEHVIVHTPGHVDRRGIDRGYTVLPVAQVKDFAAEIDHYRDIKGRYNR